MTNVGRRKAHIMPHVLHITYYYYYYYVSK